MTGRQAERTALAWTRTAVGVLATGALLSVKDFGSENETLRLVAIGLCVALTLFVYLIGLRRQRTLGRRPLPQPITPGREVRAVGIAVLLLIVVSALALLV